MIISAIIGIILGFVSTKTFFAHSWLALVPWGIAGVLVGFIPKQQKQRLLAGALYGFFLCLTFLLAGFQGDRAKLPSFALLALLLSFVGALCGVALAYISTQIRRSA
jgi:hypothetical protein